MSKSASSEIEEVKFLVRSPLIGKVEDVNVVDEEEDDEEEEDDVGGGEEERDENNNSEQEEEEGFEGEGFEEEEEKSAASAAASDAIRRRRSLLNQAPAAQEEEDEEEDGDGEGEQDDQEDDQDDQEDTRQQQERAATRGAAALQKQMPSEAKDALRKSREMVDSGLSQLYQLKLKELEAEEVLIKQMSHPEYHKRLALLSERRDRNLQRARERQSLAHENYKKTLDCSIQEAKETLLSCKRSLRTHFTNSLTRDRFTLQPTITNPYDTDSALPKVVREKKKSRMMDCSEGILDETFESPLWAVHLLKKRRRAGYDNLWNPVACVGLDRNEIEEDLSFLKTVLAVAPAESTQEKSPDVEMST